jgi:hypothetical protein
MEGVAVRIERKDLDITEGWYWGPWHSNLDISVRSVNGMLRSMAMQRAIQEDRGLLNARAEAALDDVVPVVQRAALA